jgi:hypothetical protein
MVNIFRHSAVYFMDYYNVKWDFVQLHCTQDYRVKICRGKQAFLIQFLSLFDSEKAPQNLGQMCSYDEKEGKEE